MSKNSSPNLYLQAKISILCVIKIHPQWFRDFKPCYYNRWWGESLQSSSGHCSNLFFFACKVDSNRRQLLMHCPEACSVKPTVVDECDTVLCQSLGPPIDLLFWQCYDQMYLSFSLFSRIQLEKITTTLNIFEKKMHRFSLLTRTTRRILARTWVSIWQLHMAAKPNVSQFYTLEIGFKKTMHYKQSLMVWPQCVFGYNYLNDCIKGGPGPSSDGTMHIKALPLRCSHSAQLILTRTEQSSVHFIQHSLLSHKFNFLIWTFYPQKL